MNRLRAIILVALLLIFDINSFASTVSENDGSAFITKAEFDSLKNSFQAQIDSYNTGIDNKIDSAIASYLSGITVQSKQKLDDYLTSIKSTYEYGTRFVDKNVSNAYNSNSDSFTQGGMWLFHVWGWNIVSATYTTQVNLVTNNYTAHRFVAKPDTITGKRVYLKDASISKTTKYFGPYLTYSTTPNEFVKVEKVTSDWTTTEIWMIKDTTTSSIPARTWDLTSLDKSGTVTLSNYYVANKAGGTFNVGTPDGTIIMSYNDNTSEKLYSYASQSAQGKSYTNTSSKKIYGIDYDNKSKLETEVTEGTRFEGDQPGVQNQGFKTADSSPDYGLGSNLSGRWKFKFKTPTTYNKNNNELYNWPATKVIETAVPQYAGVPVTKVEKGGKIKFKLTLKTLKTSDLSANTASCDIYFKVGQFSNNDLTSESTIIKKYTGKTAGDIDIELEVKTTDLATDKYIYVKAVTSTADTIIDLVTKTGTSIEEELDS